MKSRFLQPYTNYFWMWEDASVIAIPNGNTIAYTELLKECLGPLRSNGFPPFGTFLLAIVATDSNGKANLEKIEAIIEKIDLEPHVQSMCRAGFAFLHDLNKLHYWYADRHKRIVLLESVFRNCHNIGSVKQALEDFKWLETFALRDFEEIMVVSGNVVKQEFEPLSILHFKFQDSDSLANAMFGTQPITDVVDPAVSAPEKPKDLVDELLGTKSTERVGALVKTLWAGLNLPFHSHATAQQANGGVADIANKGNFDRLLISEFANDDLLFLTRLANNESLYLNQESPPDANNLKRTILIDASVKNWGTPKTLAFSLAIAITNHPKTDMVCETIVVGDDFEPVKVDSVEGLIDALEKVKPSLSAAKGLDRYFEEPKPTQGETFLITEKTTDSDSSMQRVRLENAEAITYLIRTDAFGAIDIYKRQGKGLKHNQRIDLPLQDLWSRSLARDNAEESIEGHIPILFRNAQGHLGIRPNVAGDLFKIDKEYALFRLHVNNGKVHEIGWEMIIQKLPFKCSFFEVVLAPDGVNHVFLFKQDTREFCIVNVETQEQVSGKFEHWKNARGLQFVYAGNGFHHYNGKGSWMIDLSGNVHQSDFTLIEPHDLRTVRDKEIAEVNGYLYHGDSILKKLEKVVINQDGNLQFNKHQFHLNHSHHFKLKLNDPGIYRAEAEPLGNGVFVFPDGSKVHMVRSGMIVLESSSPSIPSIFIPSALELSLGVATNTSFSGNTFYQRKPQFHVHLKSIDDTPLAVIKSIRSNTELSLKTAKELIDNRPCTIPCYLNEVKVKAFIEQLKELGARADYFPTDEAMMLQVIVTPDFFCQEYVDPFISQILAHGT
ncbi:MAG: hypothetical protein GC178_01660 [Flavobacteriales bacterium]|nr:hypothetical protein [Flavobacteriales bacterium]